MASALQSAVRIIQEGNYTPLVIATGVGYDYILTFADEIDYIWNKPWTWVSVLFLLARYSGLFFVIVFPLSASSLLPHPEKTCVFTSHLSFVVDVSDSLITFKQLRYFQGGMFYILGLWVIMIFLASADLVMILRVWTLYGRSKFILGVLLAFYFAQMIIGIVACAYQSAQHKLLAVPIQVLDYSLCEMKLGTVSSEIMDVAQLALAVLMSLLVVIKFVTQSVRMYRATKKVQLNRYMNLLVREGMIYFLAMLAYAAIDMVYDFDDDVPTQGWWILVTVLPQSVPAVALVPRFILNLRKLYARDLQGRHDGDIDTAFGLTTASSRDVALTTISFGDAGHEELERGEEGEETPTEEWEMRNAGGDRV